MEDFVKEWMDHPSWWFSKDPMHDAHIVDTYGHLLDADWNDKEDVVGRVLVWDQLPRHIFRGHDAAHIVTYYLEKACDVVARNLHVVDGLSDTEFMFFWLPWRHCRTYDRVLPVMQATWERIQRGGWKPSVWLRKFLRATYVNCPKYDQSLLMYKAGHGQDLASLAAVLDYDGVTREGQMERVIPGQWDEVTECVRASGGIIVSLSGGVDSMVALDLVKRMFGHGVVVAAVHINYDNRDTSAAEEAMVSRWCMERQVPLYVRRISEIHRKPCMDIEARELYETYTKGVRFGTYKTTWKAMGLDGAPVVLLGHNADDGVENIIQNMTFGVKYDNMIGMKRESMQDGVRCLRPLLRVAKRRILKHARATGVPYLYDSTISWCVRGRIRDDLVPAIERFNPRTVDGLVEVADVMSELYGVMRMSVDDWRAGMVEVEKNVWEKVVVTLPRSALFWKDLFMRHWGVCPSNRSMTHFMSRLPVLERVAKVNVRHCVVIKKGLQMDFYKRGTGSMCLRFVAGG